MSQLKDKTAVGRKQEIKSCYQSKFIFVTVCILRSSMDLQYKHNAKSYCEGHPRD